MVIAVAPTPEERLRVAQLVGSQASLLLVATREEAIRLLLGDAPPSYVQPVAIEPSAPSAIRSRIGAEDPDGAPVAVDSDLRTASWDGRAVALSPLEHDLLCCLLAQIGRTCSFAMLHQRIWGNGHLGDGSDVQSVVKRLRRKLRDLGCPLRIMAVRGVGLRLADERLAFSP